MRTRSATEWREFWRDGGERELAGILGEYADYAPRVASLLGSRASPDALAAELGRIRRDELGAAPDGNADRALAETIRAWFQQA